MDKCRAMPPPHPQGQELAQDMSDQWALSIAAMGSASTRIFERFFKAGFNVKGEFEDLGSSGFGGNPYLMGPGVGFGASEQDALVEAAKYL